MSTINVKNPKLITFKKLLSFLWPRNFSGAKIRLMIAIVALITSKGMIVVIPALFKAIIDALTIPHKSDFSAHIPLIITLIIGYGGVRILSSLFSEIRDTTFAKVTQSTLRQVGLDVFDHLHRLSLRFHLARHTGGVSRTIERGTKAIETLITFLTFNIIPTAIEIILVSIIISIFYDIRYTSIIISTMISYIIYTLWIAEWRIRYVREMNAADTTAQSKAIDSLLNYETVKYFGNEKHEHDRFNEGLIIYEKSAIQNKWSLAYLNFGQAVILSIGLIAIITIAAIDVQNGILTTGDLVAINTFLIQLTIPLFNLGFAYREIKLSLVNIEQMFELLHEPYEITDTTGALTINTINDGIQFNNVSFCYNDDREILNNVSFHIPQGHTVAVVGSSGAGKSTLARLLFRFYDVSSGRITIDGTDIRHITQKSLRAIIGIVPQDTVLFNDTIYYNIAYGNPKATDDDINEAAKKAEIYDFIQSLPDAFNTRVGERGLKLSGGEKQRVAIARTLLKKPSFFIFDEATSALDTKTEKLIQENLLQISKNKTTLIIAHRLSTIVHANTIIVLDKGTIAEQGSHNELMDGNGAYARMWQRQQAENGAN